MTTTIETYDPATCVTAKELRAKGVQIPLEIPDPAWVPKNKVRYAIHDAVTTCDEDAGRIEAVIPVHIDAEFKRIDIAVEETVEKISVVSTECSAMVGEKKP